MNLILACKLDDAQLILNRNSKYSYLPKFSFASVLIELNTSDFEFSYKSVMKKLSKVKSTINLLSKIKDRDYLSKILAGSIPFEKIRNYHHQYTETTDTESSSQVFWKLWDLDISSFKAEIQLMEGLVQLYFKYYLKSSVNILHAYRNYEKINTDLISVNQSLGILPNGAGLIVEACQILKISISESMLLLLNVFRIIPTTFPYFRNSYLKIIKVLDRKHLGLRNLYQLSRKSPAKAISATVVYLTAIILGPNMYFATKDIDFNDISSSLGVIKDAW